MASIFSRVAKVCLIDLRIKFTLIVGSVTSLRVTLFVYVYLSCCKQ